MFVGRVVMMRGVVTGVTGGGTCRVSGRGAGGCMRRMSGNCSVELYVWVSQGPGVSCANDDVHSVSFRWTDEKVFEAIY